MASETPETDPFLAMIEIRIAKLQTLADSYRDAKAAGALGPIGEGDGSPAPFTFNAGASSSTRSASNAPIDPAHLESSQRSMIVNAIAAPSATPPMRASTGFLVIQPTPSAH